MKALVFDGSLRLEPEYPMPILSTGQALLKIKHAGICNTDIEITKGYMGFRGVLGHEFVALVEQGSAEWVGKRVVGDINIADGTCDLCGRGIPSQCRHRTTMGIDRHNGAFAEYMALTETNLHVVPDNVSDDEAVFVEPLAAATQILEAVMIKPQDKVIVVGAGKLGLLSAQVIKLTGADVSVVVRRDKQAELVERWGIQAVRREEVPLQQAQVVVDCTGVSDGFSDSLDWVEPRGAIVLKSTYATLPQVNLTRVVIDEVRVIGSRCGNFDAALRLLSAGLVDVKSLIEARYPIDDALTAFTYAQGRGVMKVLVDF